MLSKATRQLEASRPFKASLGLALCAFGVALLVFAGGCEDGCVRNSDCPADYQCTEALCAPKHQPEGGMDAAPDAPSDDDAG